MVDKLSGPAYFSILFRAIVDWNRGQSVFIPIIERVFNLERPMKKWECIVCGFIYDEAAGLPDEGIAPGTRWEDVPEEWECPECGVTKSDFEMIEI